MSESMQLAADLKIQKASERESGAWDDFVRAQPNWTHFHLYGWRRVIEQVFRHRSDYLIAGNGSAIRGVLPLVRVRSLLFGDFMVSLPFVNYGGPLGDYEAIKALEAHARAMSDDRDIDLLELRCREEMPLQMRVSKRKITVVTDLPAGGSQVLWKALDAKVRSQVRKPMKEGVEVKFGHDLLADFYDVFARHMRDLGTPVMPAKFFAHCASEFGDSMWVGVAYLENEPVAAGCGFEWQSEFEITWASSLRQHARIAPNMLLYWSFMERACGRGMSRFNFGRCTPESGTHRFKKQWNSHDEQLWWYQVADSAEAATPSPNGKYSLGPRIWRHLPLRVATLLGPRIVRNIP